MKKSIWKSPPSLQVSGKNIVCKVNWSIYGLKKSSWKWNHKLTSTLIELGYHQSMSDYSLFTNKKLNYFTVVLVYYDDHMVVGK